MKINTRHVHSFLAVSACAALALLVALVAQPASAQQQASSEPRLVGSVEELRSALGESRRPIALRPGIYDMVRIENVAAGSPLVITAADPNAPPTIRRMVVTGSSDIVIDRLSFAPASGEGSLLDVTRSARIEVRRARFTGSGDLALDRRHRGLSAEQVDGLKIIDSRFDSVERAVVLTRSRRTEMAHNDFRRLGAGAVDIFASEDVEVVANRFGGFRADGARVGSFIRAFTRGAGASTRNVRIADNVMIQDTDTITDGVIFTNEDKLPYQSLEISNNVIVIAGPHGITVDQGTGVKVERNVVIETEAAIFNGTMRMLRVTGGTLAGNLATAYGLVESRDIARTMNLTVPRMDRRARKAYLARILNGLEGKGDGRIQARIGVTEAHRTSGPRA